MKIVGGLSYPDTAEEFAEAILSYTEAIERSIKKSLSGVTFAQGNLYLSDVLFSISVLNQMAHVYLLDRKSKLEDLRKVEE